MKNIRQIGYAELKVRKIRVIGYAELKVRGRKRKGGLREAEK